MAKGTIMGEAFVITSEVKLEDIKTLEKFNPEALVLKDEEGEPTFAIGTTEGAGNLTIYGATFSGEARDGSGKATITMDISEVEGDVKEQIIDIFGASLTKLKEIEKKIPEAISKVAAERAAISADITLA